MRTLTILIPAHNEAETVGEVVRRAVEQPLPGGMVREIILVDDGSNDSTASVMEGLPARFPDVPMTVLHRFIRGGKGAALREGWGRAKGDILLIQDADLEYDAADYPTLLDPLLQGQAEMVVGSRFLGSGGKALSVRQRWANRLLTAWANWFTGLGLTDLEGGLKALSREVYSRFIPVCNGFDVEAEMVLRAVKIRRSNGDPIRVVEVPVSYHPRGYAEGKKVGWCDGVWTLFLIAWLGLRQRGKMDSA